MTLYVSGSFEMKGETFYCGEIAQAAKNLFIWRRYAYPVSLVNLDSDNRPPIIDKGRCKTMSQAQGKLHEVSKEIVGKLKELRSIVLEDTDKETSEPQLEESTPS